MQKKRKLIILAGALAIIVLIPCLYYFFIPRVELEIKTVFYESTGGPIFVGVKAKNLGTLDLDDFRMSVEIYLVNKSGNGNGFPAESLIVSKTLKDSSLKPWYAEDAKELDLNFTEDQYEWFGILISVKFKGDGKRYSKEFRHLAKDYVTLDWIDRIYEWRV